MSTFTRFVTMVLLGAVAVLIVTGVAMLYGTWWAWVSDAHRIGGFVLVALIPWKSVVVYKSLRWRLKKGLGQWLESLLSLGTAALILAVAVLGLMWMWRLGPYQTALGQTVISLHWILGLVFIPMIIYHTIRRWPQPRLADLTSRRNLLRLGGLGAAGIGGWLFGLVLARLQATEERPRRPVTGSRGFGEFTGNDYPVTGEYTWSIDTTQWQLMVDGAVEEAATLTYQDILALEQDQITVILDCTSGWWSIQEWQGPRLTTLLENVRTPGGVAGVRLYSASGYNHSYPLAEARKMVLATHVTGEVLDPRHGFPMRAVVPDRRGWFWVKWLVRIEVLDNPLDVAGGVIYAPRQVLRQF